MNFSPPHVTIVGVGLLGGSLGLAMKRRWPKVQIAGVGRRSASLAAALRRGCIDTAHLNPAECLGQSDLVVLATPVGAFEEYLQAIKQHLKPSAIVTDVGSTKAHVARSAQRILGKAGPFVGSHPMAGNETKGPAHADAGLYEGALCIITPTVHTSQVRLRKVEQLWKAVGMKTLRMSPAAHDRAVAQISHLPHVLASVLMMLPGEADLAIAATGFADMTRLSGGDPEMWRDIIATNRPAILAALKKFAGGTEKLRKLIEADNSKAIEKFLSRAKQRRDKSIRS